MSLNSDFQKLYVDGLIHLYELDASSLELAFYVSMAI